MEDSGVPSLLSLCVQATVEHLLRGDELLSEVYDFPPHLFDEVMMCSPPLVLQKLHSGMPISKLEDQDAFVSCSEKSRKRRRYGKFDQAWQALFKLRWPKGFNCLQYADWQQAYWEAHLQNCFDEVVEKAMLPSFNERISQTSIPDDILNFIGYKKNMETSTSDYSRLYEHCRQFGCYLRSVRLQNVLCVEETCDLLRNSRLESLILKLITSKEHIEVLRDLLIQSSETLTSVEFSYCKLSIIDAICNSLYMKGMHNHGIQHFFVHGSRFLDKNEVPLPNGLSSFPSLGRSLCSLKFCNNRLDWNFGRLVFKSLIDASSELSILDLSENFIGGWLYDFKRNFLPGLSCHLDGKSLRYLQMLNLRDNNLQKQDMDDLRNALPYMPHLQILDLSHNPIEDDGIRSLISSFSGASEERYPLHDLSVESCDLSCVGVADLLATISSFKSPLISLSIADNHLGSKVAEYLGGVFQSEIRVLNISGIGLGLSGFKELCKLTYTDIKLEEINISKNFGGIEAAKFLSWLIERAPELTVVNASHNFMPPESLIILSSTLKSAKAKLERLELLGNKWESLPGASELLNFRHNGQPIVVFSIGGDPQLFPYDDDP
ncbi:hypothetical protein SAY86_006131 [Trapa natans]|uniref:Uncharacterized protein n=1 Tax=Trapa natans TaxID=22666 RepID=A0AAN7KY96_TRANT|nr:hypothetical protein SAY86_006131 [Trapa natans]